MQRSDQLGQTARSASRTRVRNAALIAALAAGIGGAAVLTDGATPVLAQGSLGGNQSLTETTFSTLAERVTPAVVAVRVEDGRSDKGNLDEMVPPDSQFRDFFERFFEERGGGRGFHFDQRGDNNRPVRPRLSQGSGFIISADGHVVTNNHVVENANKITVVTNDGEEYSATLVGTDPRTDLAVLKIDDGDALPYVDFTATEAKVGDWVMAVGNPFGLGGTVTTGIVSARGRNIGTGPYDDFIQIDAAVNRGNSGGPTFNLEGEVIGVNTAIFSPNGGSVGIGFAIPASIATHVVDQLINNGEITRGWIGVSIQNVSPEIAQSVGLDRPGGAIVAEVFANGPAEASGVEPGDVVLKVNGEDIDSTSDLARSIADITPGAEATLLVHRDRTEQEIKVEIGTMPSNPELASSEKGKVPAPDRTVEFERLAELGLAVEPASQASGDETMRGVVVTEVRADSEAGDKGISQGDRILRVAGTEVNTPGELNAALDSARADGLASVLVLLRTNDGQRFVTLELTRA